MLSTEIEMFVREVAFETLSKLINPQLTLEINCDFIHPWLVKESI